MTVILTIIEKMFICMLLLMAAEYICNSLFLYTLAAAEGLNRKYMAWLPVANIYYLGEIAGNVIENNKFVGNYYKAITAGLTIVVLSYFTPLPAIAMMIGFFVIIGFEMMSYYYIFDNTVPAGTVLFCVMCFINPVGAIVKAIFIINKDWYLWLSERDKQVIYDNADERVEPVEAPEIVNTEAEDMKAEVTEAEIIDDMNNQLDEAFPVENRQGEDLGYNPYQE